MPARSHKPRTLRRRLTVMLTLVVTALAAAIVVLSAVPLYNSLTTQLDTTLQQASNRSVNAIPNWGTFSGLDFDQDLQDVDSSQPPGLTVAQSAGTISVFDAGSVIRAGYFDTNGDYQSLTGEQIAALTAIPSDGSVHALSIPDLGGYRAISTTTVNGGRTITALSTDSIRSTVTGFVITAGVVSLFAVAAAAALGAVLIRRALGPLTDLAKTAQSVSRLPLAHGASVTARVPENVLGASSEVAEVAHSMNAMLTHIDSAFAALDASENKLRAFVADASHELRTPLASICGYAELLDRTSAVRGEEGTRSLSRIRSESTRMAKLVEDLLLLARLDNERPLESVPFDGVPAVIETVADAHVTGPDHSWHLGLKSDDDGEIEAVTILGDATAFRQIVTNLVSNARIHTPAGTNVTVSLHRRGEQVELSIQDDGPGIPEKIRDTVFDRFVKADASRTPGRGSSGLGLAIVSALAKAQGGHVAMESAPGRTIFQVFLIAVAEEPPAE